MSRLRRFLLLAALGSVVGWWWPPIADTEEASKQVRAGAAWAAPELPRRPDLSAQGLSVTGSTIFEPEAASPVRGGAAGPPADVRWRVAGILGRGDQREVLISFRAGTKPDMKLSVGQLLPSGHKITSIGEADVCVEIGNRRYLLGVEYRE